MRAFVSFMVFLSAVMLPFCAFAENYSNIDRRAIVTPVFMERDIDTLVAHLTKGLRTEKEKARAIAVWIAYRIDYDDIKNKKVMAYVAKQKGTVPDTGDALVTRKGVCIDFAKLFYKMATAAGIEAAIVTGYAGAVSSADLKKGGVIKHAWNAAKLDGEWYLLDVTWSSVNLKDKNMSDNQYERDLRKRKKGSISVYHESKRNSYHKTFREEWFLTPPEEMIKTHFPDDDKWQLLKSKVSVKDFLR